MSSGARRYDVNTKQLFKWRRQFAGPLSAPLLEPLRLLPVEIAPTRALAPEDRSGHPLVLSTPLKCTIEITLRGGTKVRIKGTVDPAAVSAIAVCEVGPA